MKNNKTIYVIDLAMYNLYYIIFPIRIIVWLISFRILGYPVNMKSSRKRLILISIIAYGVRVNGIPIASIPVPHMVSISVIFKISFKQFS